MEKEEPTMSEVKDHGENELEETQCHNWEIIRKHSTPQGKETFFI